MKKTLLALSLVLLLSACDESSDQDRREEGYTGGGINSYAGSTKSRGEMRMVAPAPAMAPMDNASMVVQSAPSGMVLDRTNMGDRKIAETHNLGIETTYDELEPRYHRDFQECVKMGCQIINSNVNKESNANISARIAPDKLGAFLDFLAQGDGKIESHQVSADDYTMEYSDVDASIKNLVAVRDRISSLLNSRAQTVDDILRIEQELSRIQIQLDQHTARMRILQKMTMLATVNINYSVQYRPSDIKPYELNNTWRHAANQFMRAVDRMIQFTFAALPWIPFIFAGLWLTVRAFMFAVNRKAFRLPWRK